MNRQQNLYKAYASNGSICVNNLCSPIPSSRLTGKRMNVALYSPTTTTGQYTLYLFMERWTCSSCWRLAKALGQMEKRLTDYGITVLLVGQNHYFQQANRLAKELGLPFRLITDEHHSLKRLYGYGERVCETHHQSLLLVDKKGRVRDWRQVLISGKKRQKSAG